MCQYHESTPNWSLAIEVLRDLAQAGHEALLVGGCVRDHLLAIPAKECDIATDAVPQKLIETYGENCKPIGIEFGVVLIARGGQRVEVTTYRSESLYADHRHPSSVKFSTREADAQRRDFTVNALYWNPFTDEIFDHVGGIPDLEKKLLRAVGNADARFEEDALRVLRALRFAATHGFEIESQTWSALSRHVRDLSALSVERIREELIRGFTGKDPARFLDLLDHSGALEILLPEVARMKGVAQPPEYHPEGDVLTHTKLLLKKLGPNPSVTLAFAALLHDVGKPVTQTRVGDRITFPNHDQVGAELTDEICRRLKFSNAEREQVVEMVRRHMMFISIKEMRPAKRARFLAAPTITEELELHKADCEASHGKLDNYYFARTELHKLRAGGVARTLPPPLITGHDLRDKLQIPPGPIYRKILSAVQDAQLEGQIATHEQALEFARRLLPQREDSASDQDPIAQ
jgi:poly(A) polymerase